MESGAARQDVTGLYAGIIQQAITDIQTKDVSMETIFDVSEFFASEWGKAVMDMLGVDYRTIDAKCQITAKRKMAERFIDYRKRNFADWQIGHLLKMPRRTFDRYRQELDIAIKHKRREEELREKQEARQPLGL